MSDKPISLDDLVKANKTQFDTIVSTQMDQSGLRDALQVDRGLDKASSDIAQEAIFETSNNISQILTERYGENWSHEILEHSVENDEVRVRCKLTVNSATHTQFGTARNTGNIGITLQRATENAIGRCYRELVPILEADTNSSVVSPLEAFKEKSSGLTPIRTQRPVSRSQLARQKQRTTVRRVFNDCRP